MEIDWMFLDFMPSWPSEDGWTLQLSIVNGTKKWSAKKIGEIDVKKAINLWNTTQNGLRNQPK